MADYAIEWDGKTVTLPPAGPINPDGVSWAWIRDDDGNGIYDRRLVEYADTTFAVHGKKVGSISVPVVLIPRPDNPFDSDAVSIALPKSMGGDEEERCLGYLYRHTTEYWGIANGGRKDLVARLAAFSDEGEVRFTAIMSRDSDPAELEKYGCSSDDEGWDIRYRIPEFRLDLPKARIMGAAIRDFLAEHEKDGYGSDSQRLNRRLTDEELTKTPQTRWLHELRTELVRRLTNEVVTHSKSNHYASLEIRRQSNFAVKVVNEDGGCIGRVWTHPELVSVGSEFDRPAVIETLAREGITLPFDPTPGWLNASLQPESGVWIHVAWLGRITGMNVEPILASFDVETKELHVFAPELAAPIEGLVRRGGHVPQKVLLTNHPRDPHQFFGQDLITRLENPKTPRRLRPGARELVPAEWAEQIEASWRAQQEMHARNDLTSLKLLYNNNSGDLRPPDDPQFPPGLFGPSRLDDDEPSDDKQLESAGGCRLCGEALNPHSEPSQYCLDCLHDARSGLFVDRGFKEQAWHQAVIWSLNKLAVIEFGGAPARDQLRKMPNDGPNADLLMLCRMLTARSGYVVPGGDRKVYSWTDWLAEAGLLTDGIRTSRGVTVMAKDGHICRSLLERQIDDFFFDNGIQHETEPYYPFDPDINPDGYRADWRLADGTYVEALGFTTNPVYMAKAERKISLAARHQIPVLTVTESELPNLLNIFAKWLPHDSDRPQYVDLPPRPARAARRSESVPAANRNGRNPSNSQLRSDRLERCRMAVELQASGATRKQISQHLGVSQDVVPSLLRDGKFFANPQSDRSRLALAEEAASARKRGLTRAGFRDEARLSNAKTDECWRDADVLFGPSETA